MTSAVLKPDVASVHGRSPDIIVYELIGEWADLPQDWMHFGSFTGMTVPSPEKLPNDFGPLARRYLKLCWAADQVAVSGDGWFQIVPYRFPDGGNCFLVFWRQDAKVGPTFVASPVELSALEHERGN